MTGLLPCPLCGGDAQLGTCWIGEDRSTREPAVRCTACSCRATLAAWGVRHPAYSAGDCGVWQPIDTAPKDGTKIVAARFAKKREGDDMDPIVSTTWWRREEDHKGYVGWGEFNEKFWPPTHWMPIPPGPSATAPLRRRSEEDRLRYILQQIADFPYVGDKAAQQMQLMAKGALLVSSTHSLPGEG